MEAGQGLGDSKVLGRRDEGLVAGWLGESTSVNPSVQEQLGDSKARIEGSHERNPPNEMFPSSRPIEVAMQHLYIAKSLSLVRH